MQAEYRAYITKIRDLKQDIHDSLSFIGWENHVNKGDTIFCEANGVLYVESSYAVFDKAMEYIVRGKIGPEGQRARNFVKSLRWDELTNIFQQTLSRGMPGFRLEVVTSPSINNHILHSKPLAVLGG